MGPMSDDDQELLERARSGSQDALDQLLERHQSQVYRFGMKTCRDPEDTKDSGSSLGQSRTAEVPGQWRLNPFVDAWLSRDGGSVAVQISETTVRPR